MKKLNKINIFLASSEELSEERKEISSFIRQENDKLVKKGIYLKLVVWEELSQSLQGGRIQNHFNEEMLKCDIIIVLFYTKIGKFTKEEFYVAYKSLREGKKPNCIFIYFKEGSTKHLKKDYIEIITLKEEIERYEQLYNTFESIDELKVKFNRQLNLILDEINSPKCLMKNTIKVNQMKSMNRRVDAAVPEYIKLNEKIDLIVQVRFFDSPFLELSDFPIKFRPSTIERTSETVNIDFPVNKETMELDTAYLFIKIIKSDYFKIEGSLEKKIEIPPDLYSKKIMFYLIPLKEGNCRINIEVYSIKEYVYLGAIPIETFVNRTTKKSSDFKIGQLFLNVKVADEYIDEPFQNRTSIPTTVTKSSPFAFTWLQKFDKIFKLFNHMPKKNKFRFRANIKNDKFCNNRLSENKKIGSYVIEERIGGDDMYEVFLGGHENKNLKLKVAIKELKPELTDHYYYYKDHFLRELEVLSTLYHKNIVKLFDFRENPLALVMEYVDGSILSKVIKHANKPPNNGLSIDQFVYIAMEICEGLWYTHSKFDENGKPIGIVHQDITSYNIIISYEGSVKITGFGISKATTLSSARVRVTKGTYSYMSPEQIHVKEAKQQSDIFSLGIVLYEMLSGRRLKTIKREYNSFTTTKKQKIPTINTIRKDISDKINDIVMKCLEEKIQNRYQNVKEILDDLYIFKKEQKITYQSTDLSNFMKQTFNF